MFFTCKQVSNQLSKEDYEKLSPLDKFTLKFHVWICPICGKYNQQVMKFQDMARNFRLKQEEYLESDSPESPHLDEKAKKRLQDILDQDKKAS
ncbi:hypothetical protein P3T73_05360 [Kiritimatiellota bacterium B12222]|nr:hypothetical protein P3T73_05360 [Kiritimatiellota bacterium B12222]